VPVPGFGAGVWTPEGNLVRYIDRHLLPGEPYWGTWDPEGIMSTFPAVATGLLGVLAGHWLRAEAGPPGKTLTGEMRANYLFLAGIAAVILGLLWGLAFPINKSLWTSSFALLTGGLSAMLLAAFYWAIEVRGRRKWAFPLVVIGLNPIAIYLGVSVIPFDEITRRLVGGDISAMLGSGRDLFEAVVQLLIEWLVLLWMFRRKIFIRC
ncbi:MAG: acyltransferase family protein, partial [Syntrophothermus sp.]